MDSNTHSVQMGMVVFGCAGWMISLWAAVAYSYWSVAALAAACGGG